MEDRIKNVMTAVLDIGIDEINDATSQDTVETWDSLKHMSLVVALEEEFGVHLTDEQVVEMLNFKLIKLILEEALKG